MNDLAESFLTLSEREKLIQCVKNVEKKTSGEIVPVIAGASYDYPRASALGALLGSTLIAMLITLLFNHDDMWLFLCIFFAAYALLYRLLSMVPNLKRLLISKSEIEEEVEEGAITTFFKHELFRTRDETGILIYVSVFERKVWVLADRGINQKVNPDVWKKVAANISKGIYENRPGEALCEAVEECGNLISTNFPIRSDDTDELPNLIINGRAQE